MVKALKNSWTVIYIKEIMPVESLMDTVNISGQTDRSSKDTSSKIFVLICLSAGSSFIEWIDHFRNGLREGHGTWKRSVGDSDTYEGQYVNDKKSGYG